MPHPNPQPRFLRRTWSRLHGSLRARVFIPIATTATGLTLVMVWAAVEIHGADMKRASFDRALLFANLAAEGITEEMRQTGGRDLGLLLSALKGHRTEIEAVSVAGPDGHVHYSSDQRLVETRPWTVAALDWTRPVDQGSSFAVLRPMMNEQRCASCHGSESKLNGWLAVTFSKAPMVAAKRRLTSALLLAAIPSLLLLLSVTLLLVRREAISPIDRLVAAMRRAQAGEIVRADEGRPDEIGIAARNFDATMAALRRSRAELEKTYELRMIQADRFAMVGQMATGLAHEIKNPLAGLSGALELLAEDLGHTAHREVLGEMQHQVRRLGGIMEGLLSFARPPKAQLRSTDLHSVLEKVLFLVSRQRQSSRVEVRREFDSQLPSVRADPGQLEQVFLNICLNAFEAMNGKGGRLCVRTALDGDQARVEIEDDGPGIPEEVRSHVFTPFFTTRSNGTGLGLAITARLVSEHGGHVRFHCPPKGGTTFVVTLPVEGGATAELPVAPTAVLEDGGLKAVA